MIEPHDELECRRCGTVWRPEFTVTGRVIEHCRMPEEERLMTLKWYDGEVEIDWTEAERRVMAYYGVVDPPLTVAKNKKVRDPNGWAATWIVVGGLALFLFFIFMVEAHACAMSYCQDDAPERTYVRSNWESGRQIVGDLYDPGHGRPIQIRNNSRQIIGTIDDRKVLDEARRILGEIDADR